MLPTVSIEDLRGLFTKPYGEDAPTKSKWAEFYNDNVTFIDPTQETKGLDSYVAVSYTHLTLPTTPYV